MEDDDLTTDTLATKAVLTPDGLCVKHPHVRLRGRDAQGHIVHRDSCYECDREFAQARRTLQERQQELDRQLQALDTKTPTGAGVGVGSGGGGGSARKKSTDTSVSSHSSLPAVPSPYPYYPPPPPHYYPGYGYPGADGPHYPPPPYGYPPPPPHNQYGPPQPPPPQQLYQPPLKDEEEPPKRSTAPGPSSPPPEGPKSAKEDSQLVALLQQKEQEMKDLRKQLQDQQDKLTQETAALAECKQQLEQQAHVTEMLQTQHAHAVEQIQASFQQQLHSSNQQLEQQSQVTDLLQKQLEQLQLAFQQQLQALVEESQQQREQFRKLLHEELTSLRHAVKEDIKAGQMVAGAPRVASSSPVLHAASAPSAQHAVPPPAPLPSAAATSSTTTPKLDKPKMLAEPDDLDMSTVGTSENEQQQQGTTKNAKDLPTTTNKANGGQLKKAPNHPWTSTTTNVNSTTVHPSTNNANTATNPTAKLKKPPDATGNDTDEADELHLSADESLWSAANELTDKETNILKPPTTTTKDNKPTVAASDRFTPKYVHPGDDDDDISHHPGESVDERSLEQTVASSTYGEDRQKVVSKQLLDPYGDKGVYTGVILRSTGMPHGLGRMIYDEDGRIYEGDWRHGRWHGYGRASFSNGDSYEGEYKFDQRHGRGVYKWNDGRIYDGHFSEDKRHGHGIFTWPDGAVYDGNFVNGQREGHGKYTFADGGQYEGSWKDGRYDGFGTCTWEDGRKYRGEWRNGMAHGHGVETYPNGNIRHEGQWEDDEPVR